MYSVFEKLIQWRSERTSSRLNIHVYHEMLVYIIKTVKGIIIYIGLEQYLGSVENNTI